MSIENFIPQLWDAQLQADFHEAAVAAGLVNRQYEGDLARGNSVRINAAGAITIKDYKAGVLDDGNGGTVARTTAPDKVNTTYIDLPITEERSYDFLVDDIDRVQAAGSLEQFTTNAGVALAEDADKWILGLIADCDETTPGVTGSAQGNAKLGGALSTSEDALNVLRDMRKVLNQRHVPMAQRVVVMNAEFEALLLGADSKITSVDTSGSPAGLREAILGRLYGFDLVVSENVPEVDNPAAYAFWRPGVAFVSQVQKSEAMRANDTIADRIRGLHVYGGVVIRPEAVVGYEAS